MRKVGASSYILLPKNLVDWLSTVAVRSLSRSADMMPDPDRNEFDIMPRFCHRFNQRPCITGGFVLIELQKLPSTSAILFSI